MMFTCSNLIVLLTTIDHTIFVSFIKPFIVSNKPQRHDLLNFCLGLLIMALIPPKSAPLFLFSIMQTLIFFLVYVDDIVITASSQQAIDTLITTLGRTFPVKDLGRLYYFLGVEVDHTKTGLLLSQRKYIHDLHLERKIIMAKPITSPLDTFLKLSKFGSLDFENETLY